MSVIIIFVYKCVQVHHCILIVPVVSLLNSIPSKKFLRIDKNTSI